MTMPPQRNGQSAIVTLTMNPALDITTNADIVRHTVKIRCDGARYDAGGGGIIVARFARALGALLILDTSGGGLSHVKSGVFVLKPSVRELREYTGDPLVTTSDQLAAAHDLIDRGIAQTVVVSLGSEGALLATSLESRRFSAIPVHALSGVGAGDAMVAAITVGLSAAWPLDRAVRYGIAAATAKLLTPGTAACTRADVEGFFEQVEEAPAEEVVPR